MVSNIICFLFLSKVPLISLFMHRVGRLFYSSIVDLIVHLHGLSCKFMGLICKHFQLFCIVI